MEWRWKNFSKSELQCKCCGEFPVNELFMDRLQKLREAVGFALPINSGYRCPKHNAEVAATGDDGPHTTGRAVDIAVDRGKAFMVLSRAINLGFTGIGVSQKGQSRYIHLDDLENTSVHPRPTIWSY